MVTVFGGGAWGRSLAYALSFKNKVRIVSRRNLDEFLSDKDQIKQVNLRESLNSDYFVCAIKTDALREWAQSVQLPTDIKILCACKGIESDSGKFVSQILKMQKMAFLGGPSFATEILKSLPCALNIHSESHALSLEFANLMPSFIKCYAKGDIMGAQIAGAYKNVIAIASGICEGLELGNNARAALLARGLKEMSRFGVAFGGESETFLGLSGAGDLFLSASSMMSRNFKVGFGLAKGKSVDLILRELNEVAEGIKTTRAICMLASRENIYVPIASEVLKILDNQSSPLESLERLMRS